MKLQEGKLSQNGQKNRYKDALKASLKDSNNPMSPGNRMQKIEQSGLASPTKEQLSLKQREF